MQSAGTISTNTVHKHTNSIVQPPNSTELELQISNDLATQAKNLPTKPTKYMSQLITQPRVRGIYLRPGKVLQMNRNTNQDAALGFTRGKKAELSCTSCKTGFGPFTECIVVPNMYKGSCTNCHYGSDGARCSFRSSKYSMVYKIQSCRLLTLIDEMEPSTTHARSNRSVSQTVKPRFIQSQSAEAPSTRYQSIQLQAKPVRSKRSQPKQLQSIRMQSRRSEMVRAATAILAQPAKVTKQPRRSVTLPVRSRKDIYTEIAGYYTAIARLNQELAAMEEDIEEQEGEKAENEEEDDVIELF